MVPLNWPLDAPSPQDMRWLPVEDASAVVACRNAVLGHGGPAAVPRRPPRPARPRGHRGRLQPVQTCPSGRLVAVRRTGRRPAGDCARHHRRRTGPGRRRTRPCATATPPRARWASAWARSGGWPTSATCTPRRATGRRWPRDSAPERPPAASAGPPAGLAWSGPSPAKSNAATSTGRSGWTTRSPRSCVTGSATARWPPRRPRPGWPPSSTSPTASRPRWSSGRTGG